MKSTLRGLVLITGVAAIACGGGGDDGDVQCTTLTNQTVAAGGSAQCVDVGNFFSGTAECRSDGQFDVSTCNGGNAGGPVTERGVCTGTGQGNCEAGLECIAIGTSSFCLESCAPGSTTCGTGEYCLELTTSTVSGVCDVLVDDGGVCFSSEACADASSECIPVTNTLGVCGSTCEATEIDRGQGSCSSGESCLRLPAPFVELQRNMDMNVTCMTDAECNTAEGYSCSDLSVGRVCNRDFAICGTPSVFFSTNDVNDATADNICYTAFTDPGGDLDFPGGALPQYCGVNGATGTPANSTCLDAIDGIDGFGVCIATCEDFVTGATLDCGVGATCGMPTAEESLLFTLERVPAATPVACTEDEVGTQGSCMADERCSEVMMGVFQCSAPVPCDTSAASPDDACGMDFSCESLQSGDRCARPSMICIPN